MKEVISTVINIITPKRVKLDDFVDRLCYRYTPILLGLFMFITGTVDYFGKPISCMVPTEFSGEWANYVHQYCFVTGTFFWVRNATAGDDPDPGKKVFVHYYQWVPFVIILQGIGTRIPQFLWSKGQRLSDIDFEHVNELCIGARTSVLEERESKLREASEYIMQVSKSRKFKGGIGSLVTIAYTIYKLMNILMMVAQVYFLHKFVGYEDTFWGVKLAYHSWTNKGMAERFSYFPRVAYCEVSRDFLGQEIHNQMRCVLPINMLNEKVFLVLYFWFYLLLILTLCSAFFHIFRSFSMFRLHNVRSFLGMVDKFDGRTIGQFANEVLGQDGLMLLHFVRQNAGTLIASEVGSRLYRMDI